MSEEDIPESEMKAQAEKPKSEKQTPVKKPMKQGGIASFFAKKK